MPGTDVPEPPARAEVARHPVPGRTTRLLPGIDRAGVRILARPETPDHRQQVQQGGRRLAGAFRTPRTASRYTPSPPGAAPPSPCPEYPAACATEQADALNEKII
ncbi:hypothetical protein Aau02nite_48720 [Amorphoplanes auranticolor]|uniref:Uncharacterized protein n=1 Tax=Actinoplanes auranticolor TaxID=47988 RepID=A0A919SI12_9ACTN|nr:hypothetical protein Aau02nite_48720 [Actinoplanes auranticolor]